MIASEKGHTSFMEDLLLTARADMEAVNKVRQ